MTSPKPSLSVGLISKPTKREQDIINLTKEGIISTKQMAARIQTTQRNVQLILQNLKKKGMLGLTSPIAKESEGTNEVSEGIRLHAQQFTIQPITKGIKYNKAIGKKIDIDSNTILIHSDVVQYYCNQSFFGSDVWAATAKSMVYFDRIIKTLENELQSILIKPRSQNITLVKSEYAHIENGLAKKMEREGEKIRIRGNEEGKVWFIIDNSWKLHEAETIGKNAQRDMQRVVEPFFNDMRDKENYLPSDTKEMLDNLAIISKNLTENQQQIDSKTNQYLNLLEIQTKATSHLAANIESHIPSWMSNVKVEQELRKLRRTISERQKKLGEWI